MLAAFWGVLLGFPVLRLRGDYLAIVTLAFGEIIRLVLINWVGHRRLRRHQRRAAAQLLRHSVHRQRRRLRGDVRARILARSTDVFLYYVILALAWSPPM